MAALYGRFATVPIGNGKVARDGGLTLTSNAATTVSNVARSDLSQAAGVHGVEFTFWGDEAVNGYIGALNEDASLNSYLGSTANSIGWRLLSGQIWYNGAAIAGGMPAISKGDLIGFRVTFGVPHTFEFYLNGALIQTVTAAIAGPLHFGVSFIAAAAGTMTCMVNAGQYQASSDAAAAGWSDADGAGVEARMSDLDHLSATNDAPANLRYEGVMIDGITTVAGIGFWPWGGDLPVQSGAATCTLADGGAFDALPFQDVKGTAAAVRLAPAAGKVADAETIARLAVDRIEVADDGRKKVVLVDPHDDLDLPASRAQFPPYIPGLAWQWMPLVIGAVASVPALVANGDGTSLFLSSRPLASVDVVMDRGDAMEAGTFEVAPDKQQLFMYSPPEGPVVADVSSIAAGPTPATLQQALAALFAGIGKASWSSADAAVIDAATGYAGIGYYGSGGTTVRQALAAILPSYGAWWWMDASGVLRFARIVAPDTDAGLPAFDLDESELEMTIRCVPDTAPNLTRRMTYRPNAQALGAGDLVTDLVDVPQPRRDELTALFRGRVASSGTLPRAYRHADAADPFTSLFWRQQDAQAEIDRWVAMYAAPRAFYHVALQGWDKPLPNPGQVGRLSADRLGLQAGKQLLVRYVEGNRATGSIRMTLWG